MRTVSVRVNEHDIRGSSLHVLRSALLRELTRLARNVDRMEARTGPRARRAAVRDERELVAAAQLAREVGISAEDIRMLARGRVKR